MVTFNQNQRRCLLFLCVCPKVFSFLTVTQIQQPQLSQQIRYKHCFKSCFVPQNCVDVQPLWKASTLLAATSSDEYDVAESLDEETLQKLFAKECDSDGFMSKEAALQLKIIDELLKDGDLLLEEFNAVWNAVTKSSDGSVEKIKLESFLQVYQTIDALFEEEENDDAVAKDSAEEQDVTDLETAYETLCNKESKCLTKEGLKQWTEIEQLLEDGMLGEDEFENLWEQSPKNTSHPEQIDLKGFLSFNSGLDNLFEFEEEEEEEENEPEEPVLESPVADESPKELPMVKGEDLPPGVIFANLSNGSPLISKKDLKRWVELREMLNDGDILPIEFKNIYEKVPKIEGNKLDETGFISLYEAIDELFEEIDEEEDAATAKASAASSKKEFLNLIDRTLASNSDALPCGLESSDREIEAIIAAANTLELEAASNLIIEKDGDLSLEDLAGEWDLIYTSSSTMKFNQGLSGIGGSFPNGRFAGVKQKLTYTKFLSDVEYTEKIEVPGDNSFNVKITGNWELKKSVSLFTGAATIAMRVEPGMVSYGPTSMRGDHWKSLGPLSLLNISYLDEDLRIMRGTTSTDTLFIFKRLA